MSKISYSQAIYAKSQRFEHTEHHRLDQSTISWKFSISRRFFSFCFSKNIQNDYVSGGGENIYLCSCLNDEHVRLLLYIFKERKRLMKENTQTDTNQTIPSFGSSVFCRLKTIFFPLSLFLFELSIIFFNFSIFFSHRQKRRSEDFLHRKEKI